MATTEKVGIFTHVDNKGNTMLLYPVTKMEAVDGLSEATDQLEQGIAKSVQKSNVVNNFTTTEEGFVADARALKVLYDNAQPVLKFWDQINGAYLSITTVGKICFLRVSSKGDTPFSSLQLPNGIVADGGHYFIGKANHPQLGDIWYQPFWISEDGVLSARSQNNNSDISVTWIEAETSFLMK